MNSPRQLLLSVAALAGPKGLDAALKDAEKSSGRMYLLQHNGGDPIKVSKLPGRNAPCPCNSGKKFKHCHIKATERRAPAHIEPLTQGPSEAQKVGS